MTFPPKVHQWLSTLPWWAHVILAVVAYLCCKYWVPSMAFQAPFFNGLARAVAGYAPVVGGFFLFLAVISALKAWRKRDLLEGQRGIETLRSISWREFEELAGEAYRRKGYTVTESGGGGADGGVDLILEKGNEKLLVQCKHWKLDAIGVKVIRELYGVIIAEGATGGIVVSSGRFTQEAKDFTKGKPIELLDGSELLRLISEVQKTPKPVGNGPDSVCPLCGAKMVIRTATKGPNAGKKFWGCPAFPKCRGIRQYSE